MQKAVVKDFFLTLAWIKSGENTPTSFEVVFALKDPKKRIARKYVAFVFTSYDRMNVHLKSIARNFQTHSIDSLFHGEFPVKVKYTLGFNSPDIFDSMYVNNQSTPWPSENHAHAYFKLETFI